MFFTLFPRLELLLLLLLLLHLRKQKYMKDKSINFRVELE